MADYDDDYGYRRFALLDLDEAPSNTSRPASVGPPSHAAKPQQDLDRRIAARLAGGNSVRPPATPPITACPPDEPQVDDTLIETLEDQREYAVAFLQRIARLAAWYNRTGLSPAQGDGISLEPLLPSRVAGFAGNRQVQTPKSKQLAGAAESEPPRHLQLFDGE